MRLGILAWDLDEYESLQLGRIARELGHDATLFTLDDVTCDHRDRGLDVRVDGAPASSLDVIISRVQLRAERWQSDLERLTLLSQLEGVPILDPAAPFVAAESKLVGLQWLAQAGIPVPPTVSCASVEDVRRAGDRWGQLVVKPSFGFGGADVERIDGDYRRVAPLLRRYGMMLAQPYFLHPEGDIRLTVVGDEVALSFRRVPPPEGWKANVALGATMVPCDPPPELRRLAVRAAHVMNITVAGVDVIRNGSGYLVVEINNVPGWYPGLSDDEEVAVASRIIDWAMRRTACTA